MHCVCKRAKQTTDPLMKSFLIGPLKQVALEMRCMEEELSKKEKCINHLKKEKKRSDDAADRSAFKAGRLLDKMEMMKEEHKRQQMEMLKEQHARQTDASIARRKCESEKERANKVARSSLDGRAQRRTSYAVLVESHSNASGGTLYYQCSESPHTVVHASWSIKNNSYEAARKRCAAELSNSNCPCGSTFHMVK